MIGKLSSVMSRVLFLVAFLLAGLAVWEKLLNAFGFTMLRGYAPSRLLEYAAVAVLFVIGFTATSQMAATNTIVQNRVPDELRGRVMAVYATMFMGVQPIGSLIAGGIAKHIGAPYTLAAFGTLVLVGGVDTPRAGLRVRATP